MRITITAWEPRMVAKFPAVGKVCEVPGSRVKKSTTIAQAIRRPYCPRRVEILGARMRRPRTVFSSPSASSTAPTSVAVPSAAGVPSDSIVIYP